MTLVLPLAERDSLRSSAAASDWFDFVAFRSEQQSERAELPFASIQGHPFPQHQCRLSFASISLSALPEGSSHAMREDAGLDASLNGFPANSGSVSSDAASPSTSAHISPETRSQGPLQTALHKIQHAARAIQIPQLRLPMFTLPGFEDMGPRRGNHCH